MLGWNLRYLAHPAGFANGCKQVIGSIWIPREVILFTGVIIPVLLKEIH